MKIRAGTEEERITRRLQWQSPAGIRVVGEYWLQASNPNVIIICETDSVVPMMQATTAWNDVYDITVIPAITAEEGMELAKQMMT